MMRDLDRPEAWLISVDGVPQSHVNLADPTDLDFEYVRWLGDVVDLAFPPGESLRAVHLGGGAGTLARYLAATRPRSSQLAAEIDDQLVELIRTRIGLSVPGLRVRIGDGREVLATRRADSADLIIVDCFTAGQMPAHLATVEFLVLCRSALTGPGVLTMNIGDGPGLRFARRVAATLASAFPEVAVITDPAVLRGRRYGNLIMVASGRPLPISELSRRVARPHPRASLLAGDKLRSWYGTAAALTDAESFAPPELPADLW
jgi:spermidine synthase